jgi:hypothetical protein
MEDRGQNKEFKWRVLIMSCGFIGRSEPMTGYFTIKLQSQLQMLAVLRAVTSFRRLAN